MATTTYTIPGCTLNSSSSKILFSNVAYNDTPHDSPQYYEFYEDVTLPTLPACNPANGNAWRILQIEMSGTWTWSFPWASSPFGGGSRFVNETVSPFIAPTVNGSPFVNGFLAPIGQINACASVARFSIFDYRSLMESQGDPQDWPGRVASGYSPADYLNNQPYMGLGNDQADSLNIALPFEIIITVPVNTPPVYATYVCGKQDLVGGPGRYRCGGWYPDFPFGWPYVGTRGTDYVYDQGDNWSIIVTSVNILLEEFFLNDDQWRNVCSCEGPPDHGGGSGNGNVWLFQSDDGHFHTCDDAIGYAGANAAYPVKYDTTSPVYNPTNSTSDVDARLVVDERQRIWIAFTKDGLTHPDVRAVWSEDDGHTWGFGSDVDYPILLPGCDRSTIALSQSKDKILFGGRDNNGYLNVAIMNAGDAPADTTPIVCNDNTGSPFAIDDDTFHFVGIPGGPDEWYGAFVIGGDTHLHHSGDDGQTWNPLGLSIPGGKHPTIAAAEDGIQAIAAAKVADGFGGHILQALLLYATDDSGDDSTVYTFTDETSANIAATDHTFHLMQGYDGQNRWVVSDGGTLYASADAKTWKQIKP